MRRFSMRHARCAVRYATISYASYAMCYATISYALRENFLCVMRDVLCYAMISMEATKQKQLTGARVLVF